MAVSSSSCACVILQPIEPKTEGGYVSEEIPSPAAPATASPADALSADQQLVYDTALSGENVFFTAPAGTGKSFLLKRLVIALREKHGEGAVFVTASTGIAACAVGGVTIHR